jgi:hypothetical protein
MGAGRNPHMRLNKWMNIVISGRCGNPEDEPKDQVVRDLLVSESL